jgi:hypothetical protein
MDHYSCWMVTLNYWLVEPPIVGGWLNHFITYVVPHQPPHVVVVLLHLKVNVSMRLVDF